MSLPLEVEPTLNAFSLSLAMECGSLTTAATGSLDDLFSTQTTEVDVGMEWLSVLVEDCFSSRGNCLPAPIPEKPTTDSASKLEPNSNLSSVHQFAVSGKARSKRKRIAAAEGGRASSSTWSHPHPLAHDQYFPSSDPPLLDQAYWMADSELLPKKIPNQEREQEDEEEVEEQWLPGKGKKVIMVKNKMGSSEGVARRCSHCLSQRTPQWRAGPMGPKTLCNACGVRYKSGRLLPEYRPAKSPTFVSCLHSNSHRKVLEMRMGPGTGISSRRGGSGLGSSSGGGWGGGEVSTSIMAAENV